MPHPNGLSGERIDEILVHNIYNEIFPLILINHSWYSGHCTRLSRRRPGFNSPARQFLHLPFSPSSPFPSHQTFLNKLATFNNHLKLSPLKKLLSQEGCQL
jgi:hypothetical protein